MKYRNRIPEPGTTISDFADSKKKINVDRKHTYFFWPYSDLNCGKYVKIKRNTRSEKKDS